MCYISRNAVNASEEDAVIFVGSGATGAVHKLVQALKPRIGKNKYFFYKKATLEFP